MSYINFRTPLYISQQTSTQWTQQNPVLPLDYVGAETDTGRLKWGDGLSRWDVLEYTDSVDAGYIDVSDAVSFDSPDPLIITSSPKNVEAKQDGSCFFAVSVAGGSLHYSYQWQIKYPNSDVWENLEDTATEIIFSGTDTDKLSINNIQNSINLCLFRVSVSDGITVLNSDSALFNLSYFEIITQPASTGILAGTISPSGTFSVEAESDDAISYQWQLLSSSGTWNDISGATNSSYGNINSSSFPNGVKHQTYRCSLTANTATINSNIANLFLSDPPITITVQPSGTTATSGSASFSFDYTTTIENTDIKWQVKSAGQTGWVDIASSNNKTLNLTNLKVSDNGNEYKAVVIGNSSVVLSNPATLTVTQSATVLTQPQSVVAAPNGTASFSVSFTPPSGYSGTVWIIWSSRPPDSSVWTNIPNSVTSGNNLTSNTLNITSLVRGPTRIRNYVKASVYFGPTLGSGTVIESDGTATLTIPVQATTRNRNDLVTTHPTPLTVTDGSIATFNFGSTSGITNIQRFFVWQKLLPTTGAVWTNVGEPVIFQANSSTNYPPLSFTATVSDSGTKYRAFLRSGTPTSPGNISVFSSDATLTVTLNQGLITGRLPANRPYGMIDTEYADRGQRPAKQESVGFFAYGNGRIIGVSNGGLDLNGIWVDNSASMNEASASTTVFRRGYWLNLGTGQSYYNGPAGQPPNSFPNSVGKPNRGTSRFIYSDDEGASWSIGELPLNLDWKGIAYSGGIFAAVGTTPGESTMHFLCISKDKGASWTYQNWASGKALPTIMGSPSSGFIINSAGIIRYYDGSKLYVQNDVTTWPNNNDSVPYGFSKGGRLGNNWIGYAGGKVYYSTDNGSTWSQVTSVYGQEEYEQAFAIHRDKAVVLAQDGLGIYISNDGISWTWERLYDFKTTIEGLFPGISVPTPIYVTITPYAVVIAGDEIIYFSSTEKYYFNLRGTRITSNYSVGIYRAPISFPSNVTQVYDQSSSSTNYAASQNRFAFSSLVTTRNYVCGIDLDSNSIVRVLLTTPLIEPNNPVINRADGTPFAVQNLIATPLSTTSVRLSWSVPESNGGSAITNYRIEKRSNETGRATSSGSDGFVNVTKPTSTSTTFDVTGLTSGKTYAFRVAGVNSTGIGSFSNSVSIIMPTVGDSSDLANLPTAPRNFAISISGNPTEARDFFGVNMSWLAPTSNGGQSITSYLIQYRYVQIPSSTSIINDSLFTTQPSFETLNNRTQSGPASLRWVTISNLSAVASIGGFRSGRYAIQFRIAAITSVGVSAFTNSNILTYQTGTSLVSNDGSITDLSVSLTSNPMSRTDGPGLTASWTPPLPASTYNTTGYVLEYRYQSINTDNDRRSSFNSWARLGNRNTTDSSSSFYTTWATVSGESATICLSGLRPSFAYGIQIRVAAVNAQGIGPFRESSTIDWNLV